MLITVCDIPEARRSDVERAGGTTVRFWNGLIDAQFNNHKIRANHLRTSIRCVDGGAKFIVANDEYSRIYIQ